MKKGLFIITDILMKFLLVLLVFTFLSKIRIDILNSNSTSLPFFAVILINLLVFLTFIGLFILLNYFLNKLYQKNRYITLLKQFKTLFKTNKMVSILIIVLMFSISFVTIILTFQRDIIYIPNSSPKLFEKLSQSDSYTLVNLDDKYYGFFKYDDPSVETIIHFMGNHENSAALFNQFDIYNNALFDNYNFIIIDYPTYGNSKGLLNEQSVFEMALLTYDYLVNDIGIEPSQIIISGFSIGTGPASFLAKEKQVRKLVLIAPYSSMTDAYNSYLPVFYGPFKSLVLDKYDSLKTLKEYNGNILIVASSGDEVIKYKLSAKLANNLSNASLITMADLKHNELVNNKIVILAISSFLNNN